MASLCMSLAGESSDPIPFYVLRSVFQDISREWDGQPLDVQAAAAVESVLKPRILALMAAVAAGAARDEVGRLLTEVVASRLTLSF